MRLIAIGGLKKYLEVVLYKEYRKRLVCPPHCIEISNKKYKTIKQQERMILSLVRPADSLIVFDEKGKDWSTQELEQFLKKSELFRASLVFLIGGPDGFTDSIYQKAQHILCFGKMTWPHGLVQVLFLEQLYRCQQIRLQHPYHREG